MSNKVDLIIAANDQASAIIKNISASLNSLSSTAQATIAKLSAVSQSTAFANGMNGMTQSVKGFGTAAAAVAGQNDALGNSLGALSGKQANVLASTNALTASGKGLETANRGMATAFQQTGTATDATSLKIRDLQAKLVTMSQNYQQAATGTAVYGKSTAELEQKKRTLTAALAVAQEALTKSVEGGKASQAEIEQRKAKIAGLELELNKYSSTQQQVTIKGKEDEAQLARRGVAIDKVKAQLVQLTAETQKSESVLNAQANVSKNVAAAFESLGTKAGQVATAIGKMALAAGAAGLLALGAGLKTSVTAAADFETTLNRFASVAGTSLKEAGLSVTDFSNLALKMGADTQFSAAEAATAMVELAKGGIDPVTIRSEGLKAALDLAAAGELGLADASGIVAKQLGVWSSAGVTATQITNLMSQAANASTVDVAELQLGLSQVGGVAKFAGASFQDTVTTMALIAPGFGSASDAGTSLKAVLNNLIPTTDKAAGAMQDLGLYGFDQTRALKFLADAGIKPLTNSFGDINAALYDYGVSVKAIDPQSKNAQKQFDKLRENAGLMKSAFYDSSGAFVGMEKAAQLLGDATRDLSAEQRSLAFETIFGSDGQRAAALIAEKSREGYIGMTKAMSQAGDAASQAAERNKGFNFALETMKGSIETVAIIIGSKLIPVGTQIINEFITPAINAFGDFAKEMFASNDPIQFLLTKLGEFSPVALNIVTAVSGIASGLIATLSPVITFIANNFGTIATVVGVVVAAFGGLSIIGSIVGTVTAAITTISALGGVMATLSTIAGAVVAALGGPLVLAIGGVALAIGALYLAWQTNFGGIRDTVAEYMPQIEGLLSSIGAIINEGVIPALMFLWNRVQEIFTGIVAFLSAHSAEIQTVLSAAWTVVSTVVSNALTVIKGIVTTVLAVIRGDWQGAWDALSTMLATVASNWGIIISNIFAAIKNVIVVGVQAWIAAMIASWTPAIERMSAIWTAISTAVQSGITTISNAISIASAYISAAWAIVWTGLSLIVTEVFNAVSGVVQSGITTISNAISIASAYISAAWSAVWNGLSLAVETALGAVVAVISAWAEFAKNVLLFQIGIVILAWQFAWSQLQPIVQPIFDAISTFITTTLTVIQTTISTVLAAITTTWAAVWNEVSTAATTIWTAISTTISTVVTAISTAISTTFQAIQTTISGIMTAISAVINSAWTAISTAVSGVLVQIQTKVTAIWNDIKATTTTVYQAIQSAILAVWTQIYTAISTKLSAIFTEVQTVFNQILTTITTIANNILTAIINAFSQMVTAVTTKMQEIHSIIQDKLAGALNSARQFIGEAVGIGRDIIGGMIQGITSKASEIADAAANVVSRAISAAKNALGIQSPSKEFAYLGDMSAKGYIKAMDAKQGDVAASAEALANKAKQGASQGTSSWAGVVEIAKQQIQKIAEIAGAGPQAMATANAKIASLSAEQITTWGDLSRYITAASGAIRRSAHADFEATHQLGKGATKAMREAVANEWAGIGADITKATVDGRNAAKEGFNGLKEDVKAAAAGVKTSAAGMLEGIKETITNESTGISELVKSTFKDMTRDTQDTNTDMNRAISATWREISRAVDEQVKVMKASVAGGSQEQKDAMNQQIAELRESVATKWRDMKYDVADAVRDMKRSVGDEQSQINEFMKISLAGIKDKAKEEWNAAKDEADAAIKALKAQNITDFSEIEAQLALKAQAINDNTTQAYEDLKSQVGQKLADLRGSHDSSWRDILGLVMGVTDDIKGNVPTKYSEMGSAIKKILDEIDGANKTTMNSVQTTTKTAMDATVSTTKAAMDALTGATTQGSANAISASKLLQEATGQNFDQLYKSMQAALESGTKLTDEELSKWMEIARSKAGDLPQHLALSGLEENIKKSMSAATTAVANGSGGISAAAKVIAEANTKTFDQMYKDMEALITSGTKLTDEETTKWLEIARTKVGDLPQALALNGLEAKIRDQMAAAATAVATGGGGISEAAKVIADANTRTFDQMYKDMEGLITSGTKLTSDEMTKWLDIARTKVGDLPQAMALNGLEAKIREQMGAAATAMQQGSDSVTGAAKLIADANTQTFDQMYKSMQTLITTGAKITDDELAKWLELAKQRAGDLPQVMALNELEVKLRGQMVAITQGLQSPLDEAKIVLPAAAAAIAEGIEQPINNLPEAVRPALIRVRGVMSDEMQGTVTTTRNVGPDMFNAGISVMDGLINGMSSKLGELEAIGIRISQTIERTTQQQLGIASPSKVTTWQGKMIGEGWVKGIASMTPSLANAVMAISDTMIADGAMSVGYKAQAPSEIASPYYIANRNNGNNNAFSNRMEMPQPQPPIVNIWIDGKKTSNPSDLRRSGVTVMY